MVKEIECKIGEILDMEYVIKSIIDDKNVEDDLLKFKLLTILKDIEIITTSFNTVRNKKIAEYGCVGDDGEYVINKNDENFEKYKDEINKMLFSYTTVTVRTLDSSEIFNKGIPANLLMALFPIIIDN